jgi:hypothetical protein
MLIKLLSYKGKYYINLAIKASFKKSPNKKVFKLKTSNFLINILTSNKTYSLI